MAYEEIRVKSVDGKRVSASSVTEAVRSEASTLYNNNKDALLEGTKRAGVHRGRVAIRDKLREKLGPGYREFIENTVGGETIEQVFLWNLLGMGAGHLEGRIPGAKVLGEFAGEALTQVYQDNAGELFEMAETIIKEAVGELRKNVPSQFTKVEEEATEQVGVGESAE